jgi:DNA-binding Lrp family transcriptional regulator
LDAIDRGILQILSLYQDLSLSELWFEIGEADFLEPVTRQEVLNRIESLTTRGLVERITLEPGDIRWAYERSQERIE